MCDNNNMSTVDKHQCPKGEELKTCSDCGFVGTKYPHFHRTKIRGLYQYGYCKKCQQDRTRAWKYNMDVDEMRLMLKSATHCEVCEHEFTDNRKVIDHCHTNGHVRGVLCDPCNTTLGHLEKEEYMIGNFISYLLTKNLIPNDPQRKTNINSNPPQGEKI